MEIVFLEKKEILISEESNVIYARHIIRQYAKSIGFEDFELDKLELVISELGINIVKYAGRGVFYYGKVSYGRHIGLQIISEDNGNGIHNILEYLHKKPVVDLKHSLKAGLSAIYNLTDEFSYTTASSDSGSNITIRKWLPFEESKLHFSVISRPKPGELKNGDSFYIKQLPYYSFFCVIDALGHGEDAFLIAERALEYIKFFYYLPLEEIILGCHDYLSNTRGAVLSLCKVYTYENKIEYLGIGNVEMKVYNSADSIKCFNYNGTIGMHTENFHKQEFSYSYGSTFLMYSDGIVNLSLDNFILRNSPTKIAAHIMDIFSRSNDDATILVGR